MSDKDKRKELYDVTSEQDVETNVEETVRHDRVRETDNIQKEINQTQSQAKSKYQQAKDNGQLKTGDRYKANRPNSSNPNTAQSAATNRQERPNVNTGQPSSASYNRSSSAGTGSPQGRAGHAGQPTGLEGQLDDLNQGQQGQQGGQEVPDTAPVTSVPSKEEMNETATESDGAGGSNNKNDSADKSSDKSTSGDKNPNGQEIGRREPNNDLNSIDKNSGRQSGSQERQSIDDMKGTKSKPTAAKGESKVDSSSSDSSGGIGDKLKNAKNKLTENSSSEKSKAEKSLEKGTKAAKNTAKVGGILVKLLLNPITWLIFGIILLISVALSGQQILGRSDYANNCNTSTGTSSVGATLPDDVKERANIIGQWLMSNNFESLGGKPFTKVQAAGAIGNFYGESTVNSTTMEGYYQPADHTQWSSEKILKEMGSVSHRAIGLAQWDGGRRPILLKRAIEEKKPWWDATLQLEQLKDEIDGAEAHSIKKEFASCTDVTQCTEAWRRDFERGGEGDLPKRAAFAKEFMSFYKGGGSMGMSSSGSAASCTAGGNIDASDLVQLAIASSYKPNEESGQYVAGTGDQLGGTIAKKEYKDAKKLAEEKGGKDPYAGLYASCDRFVATLFKATGKDVDIPWGPTATQYSYFQSSPKWEPVKCKDRKPGDVLITKGDGHVMIYIGDYEGKDSIASASYLHRVAGISEIQGCQGDDFYADYRPGLAGFRLKEGGK